MKRSKNRRKKILFIIIFMAAVIAAVLYMLADRYLIEHVEKQEVKASDSSVSKVKDSSVQYDDWSYKSSTTEIQISKVTQGSGNNLVTYYMADVKLTDAALLKSAFAEGKFGRNIVETTSSIAKDSNAVFAINGDYYGFRSDGILIRNGEVYRDSPARIGAALYKDGSLKSYDEASKTAAQLTAEGVIHTLSFGPVLVTDGKLLEDFDKVAIDKNFGNRSIQGLNPRTGIGMLASNHFLFIVVDGRSENYSKGMTLSQFAQLFADYGCKEAYNLDGGGSSTMYFMGRVVNRPLGKEEERAISDILYISE